MSLTVEQMIKDAKKLAGRLSQHDVITDNLISQQNELLKRIESTRQFEEDMAMLQAIVQDTPRGALVLGIQHENCYIRELQQENKDLKSALEDHEKAVSLIMTKYRQQVSQLIGGNKIDVEKSKLQNDYVNILRVLEMKSIQIQDMIGVMQTAIKLDDETFAKQEEKYQQLLLENKGLRELLQISANISQCQLPLLSPDMVDKIVQTDNIDKVAILQTCPQGQESCNDSITSEDGCDLSTSSCSENSVLEVTVVESSKLDVNSETS